MAVRHIFIARPVSGGVGKHSEWVRLAETRLQASGYVWHAVCTFTGAGLRIDAHAEVFAVMPRDDTKLNDLVLLAEDDVTLSMVLQFMLEKEGYAVLAVASGAEALSEALSKRPRVAFLDMWMPEMTGLQVCQAVRKEDCLREMTLALMTGDDDRELELRALDAGFAAFLVKPFELERMRWIIEKAFGKRSQIPRSVGATAEIEA